MESENLKMRVTARELESKTIDTLKLREDYAKKGNSETVWRKHRVWPALFCQT